jgi:hypothetical protein
MAFAQIVKNTFIEVQLEEPRLQGRRHSDSGLSYGSYLVLEQPDSPKKRAARWADIEDCSTDEECGSASMSSTCSDEESEARVQEQRARARSRAEQGGGLPASCVTVMLRHVPTKYNQESLLAEVEASFAGLFDFFYLPTNMKSKKNRGFAFINFTSAESARTFYASFHGQRLQQHSAQAKSLAVVPADVQGFESTAAQYAPASGEHSEERGCYPVFLR